jgi:hypothetical protein
MNQQEEINRCDIKVFFSQKEKHNAHVLVFVKTLQFSQLTLAKRIV